MIHLDQIRLLESKTIKAIELINMLREENKTLKKTIDTSQKRMEELESLVQEFKSDQDEIEQSILRAMKNLEQLEDEITEPESKKKITPAVDEDASPEAESESGSLIFETESDEEEKQELDIF
jgi:septal ring factor EnvC (AmiA/AmiB activator)